MAGRKRYRELEEALGTAAQLRQVLDKISLLKEHSAPPDAKRIKTQTALALVRHKAANRRAYLAVEGKKEELESLQEGHFKANLRLQNLLCQEEHLKREIEACKAFRSSHESLGLSIDDVGGQGEEQTHAHMLEQLTFELTERKRLRSLINDMKEKSILLQKDIHEKSSFLKGLKGQVADIHRSCKPVQKHIPAKFQQQAAYEMAQLLPVPLYSIYYQLAVYREAFDEENMVTVDIEGSREAASQWNGRQAKEEDKNDSGVTPMDCDDGDAMETGDDDEEPGAIRPDGSAVSNAVDRHPLSIVVTVAAKDCSPVTIRFFYLYRLNIVSVASNGQEGFLTCLYPCDTGRQSPNPATAHLLGSRKAFPYPSSLGRPYQWAQRMAGLQFLAATQEENATFLRPELEMEPSAAAADAISRISGRLLARKALDDTAAALARGHLPPLPSMTSPKVKFSGWGKITRNEYQETAGQERLEEWQYADASYFKLSISFSSPRASYDAAILVPADYPSCPALVHLAAATSGSAAPSKLPAYVEKLADKKALAAMQEVTAQTASFKMAEAAVNVNVGRFVPPQSEHLTFALQLSELANQLLAVTTK